MVRGNVMVAMVGAAMLAAMGATAHAQDVEIDKVAEKVRKSLAIVEYTYRSENLSREEVGQGIVLNKEGTVLISGALIPESLPRDYIKDIKVRVPGEKFKAQPAQFLGRTSDRIFAFVKADKPLAAEPLDLGQTGGLKLGQGIFSVALLNKNAGYEPYVGVSRVKGLLRLVHDMAGTSTFGLTRATSPVFDTSTGALVGITYPALGESITMSIEGKSARVEIRDDDQSATVLPWHECAAAFKDVPTKPFESRRPWLGIDGMTGVDEDMKAINNIEQPAAVSVGAVIPEQPADKAGLKSRDIVLTVDGKEFSTATVPELMVAHLQRAIEKKKIGDPIVLGVLREGKKVDVTIKIGPSPKMGSEMPHVYNARLGITTRDLVFADTYTRKLPADTRGVMIALVKQGGAATIGTTPLRPGYLITRVNEQDVENEKQFGEVVSKALEDKDKTEMVFRVIQSNGETMVCRVDLSK